MSKNYKKKCGTLWSLKCLLIIRNHKMAEILRNLYLQSMLNMFSFLYIFQSRILTKYHFIHLNCTESFIYTSSRASNAPFSIFIWPFEIVVRMRHDTNESPRAGIHALKLRTTDWGAIDGNKSRVIFASVFRLLLWCWFGWFFGLFCFAKGTFFVFCELK